MNATPETTSAGETRIRVWDLPTRLFHWSLAASFAGAWLTSESERWRDVHVLLGYALLALVAFRIVWGLVGPRYARFSQFVRGPGAVTRYLRSLVTGRPEHHTGHNPAGALAVLVLLALGAATALTGWATYQDIGGEWFEELHEGLATAMLVVVGVHIAAVVLSSLLHKENLVRAMITGFKRGRPDEGLRGQRLAAGLLVAVLVVGVAAWGWQAGGFAGDGPLLTARGGEHAVHRESVNDDDD